MRLVKLLPRWLTPRVEREHYEPPQDDPTQGDVAENEAALGMRQAMPLLGDIGSTCWDHWALLSVHKKAQKSES